MSSDTKQIPVYTLTMMIRQLTILTDFPVRNLTNMHQEYKLQASKNYASIILLV